MTRAPSSARTYAASGPAHSDASVTTVVPASGHAGASPSGAASTAAGIGHLADACARQSEQDGSVGDLGGRPVGECVRHRRPWVVIAGVDAEPCRDRAHVVWSGQGDRQPAAVAGRQQAGRTAGVRPARRLQVERAAAHAEHTDSRRPEPAAASPAPPSSSSAASPASRRTSCSGTATSGAVRRRPPDWSHHSLTVTPLTRSAAGQSIRSSSQRTTPSCRARVSSAHRRLSTPLARASRPRSTAELLASPFTDELIAGERHASRQWSSTAIVPTFRRPALSRWSFCRSVTTFGGDGPAAADAVVGPDDVDDTLRADRVGADRRRQPRCPAAYGLRGPG